jgi:hypothetical protein
VIHCPRCGRPARRLIRCTSCRDRVCVDGCVQDEESLTCKTCATLGADEAADLANSNEE